MMKFKIESPQAQVEFYDAPSAYVTYYAPSFYAVSEFLFWSVFGPAAQYNYRKPEYAYAALMEP
ncbi:MAG: hypothetical protein H7301_11440 [Cryobacterium sp.]|nr:hypothetical protein [Oligoflexia bacterium]